MARKPRQSAPQEPIQHVLTPEQTARLDRLVGYHTRERERQGRPAASRQEVVDLALRAAEEAVRMR